MVIPKVCNASEYHMNKNFVHPKNERLHGTTKKDTIIKQGCHASNKEKKN
jgi:hypothetical protein